MITPGHHLYSGADGIWRYSSPGEKFVQITGPDHLLRALQHIVHDASSRDDATIPPRDATAFEQLLNVFSQRGLVSPDPYQGEQQGDATWSIHVEGDNPIGVCVADLLHPHATVSRGPVDEGVISQVDVVIVCAEWLPDAHWLALDDLFVKHGKPWHMSYAEETQWVIGPMYLPGRTASYVDTRNRRLAASGVADELLAQWGYLDGDAPKPPVHWSVAAINVIAGLIAEDVVAHLYGRQVPSHGYQLLFDCARAQLERHPVLPIPDLTLETVAPGRAA